MVIIIGCYCASLTLDLHFLRTGKLIPELVTLLLRSLQGAQEVCPLLRRHLHLPDLDRGLPHLRGRLPVPGGRGRRPGDIPDITHETDATGGCPPLRGRALVPAYCEPLLAVPGVLPHDGGGGLDELVRLVDALSAVARQLVLGRHQTRRVAPKIVNCLGQFCCDGDLVVGPIKFLQQFICCVKTLDDTQ